MSDTSYLDWPFFEPRHRQLQREIDAWAGEHITPHGPHDTDAACRELVAALGAAGAVACSLGARDTLRLEAGMNLYGNDMDATHHPLESGLGWTVAFEPPTRDFIGRAALEALRAAGTSASL